MPLNKDLYKRYQDFITIGQRAIYYSKKKSPEGVDIAVRTLFGLYYNVLVELDRLKKKEGSAEDEEESR